MNSKSILFGVTASAIVDVLVPIIVVNLTDRGRTNEL